MKATLTLSGWLTHSQMIGSSWGAAVVAMPPPLNLWFFPIFPVFPTLSHQCPDLFSTTVRPPQRSLPSRGSFPSSPVLPSAVPGSTTSSTPPHNRWHCPSHVGLSHSTGNLHSSLTAWRQIYMLNRCFRPDLIETIQKNRPWKGKGDASLGGTHTMTPFRGIFWNGMTGTHWLLLVLSSLQPWISGQRWTHARKQSTRWNKWTQKSCWSTSSNVKSSTM